jgi:hypothetical protein
MPPNPEPCLTAVALRTLARIKPVTDSWWTMSRGLVLAGVPAALFAAYVTVAVTQLLWTLF